MSDSVLVDRSDEVMWIRLNRPEVFNAFDEQMGLDFVEALEGAADPASRCVVITGVGKAFCAGEDLRALGKDYASGGVPDLGGILRRRYNPAIEAIQNLRKPVVAAINGVAAGAGVSLALACDIRVMAAEASLVVAFSKVGLVPDSGGTWLLPRYLGVGRAFEMAISTDPISASGAAELGLVNEVVDGAELETRVADLAATLAAGPTVALAEIKRLIWSASGVDLKEHLEAEAVAQAVAGATADHIEGVAAFSEKRPPKFKGV